MNTPVNVETAKLLKEKGFRILPDFESSYPTIAEVVMWIYENHNIWISVDRYIDPEQSPDYRYGSCIYYDDHYYGRGNENPTEAYEAAIFYVLNLI
jgi:hypothetical protein